MAINPRTQKNYLSVKYKNQHFVLQVGNFQTKSIIYTIKQKLLAGKIEIPFIQNPKNLNTILITCYKKSDGDLQFDMI
jgi:hypothetical protein